MSQKRGMKRPMMNITQWPLRIEMMPEGDQQDEVDDRPRTNHSTLLCSTVRP